MGESLAAAGQMARILKFEKWRERDKGSKEGPHHQIIPEI